MKNFYPKAKTSIVCISSLLLFAACGGGNNGTSSAQAPAGSSALTTKLAPLPGGFYTVLRTAPADGANVSGLVRLEFWGEGIQNAEVLPAEGYEPKYGKFNITDNGGNAWIDLDTTKLPNGPLRLRVSAFNAPAGEPGVERVAMSARTWNINNTVTPGALSIASVSAPADGAGVSGTTRLEVRGSGLANVELLPATGYEPKLGAFSVSADRTYAWLDLDTKTLSDGMQNVRISAFDNTGGQPGAQEIVAMPARQWNVQNGLGDFTAHLLQGPADGAIVSGNYLYFRIAGGNIKNMELLPATGYEPKYGSASFSTEGPLAGKGGSIGVDISTLPKGPFTARISVFDQAAGAADAHEIVVMPARTWQIQ